MELTKFEKLVPGEQKAIDQLVATMEKKMLKDTTSGTKMTRDAHACNSFKMQAEVDFNLLKKQISIL